jgi:hypothetical protein
MVREDGAGGCELRSRFWMGDIHKRPGTGGWLPAFVVNRIGEEGRSLSCKEGEISPLPSSVDVGLAFPTHSRPAKHAYREHSVDSQHYRLFAGNTRLGRLVRAPTALGRDIHRHCHEEMRCLAEILPDLHTQQTGPGGRGGAQ